MATKIKTLGKQVKPADRKKAQRRAEELRKMAWELRTEAMLLEVAATAEENRADKRARAARAARKLGLLARQVKLGAESERAGSAAG